MHLAIEFLKTPLGLSEILGQAHQIASTLLEENAADVDLHSRWPERSIRALQSAGLAGLVIPQQYGGLGQGLYAMVRVCEILGQHCSSTAMCLGMHFSASAVLAAKPSEMQIHKYLIPICEGKHLCTLALSEPENGIHFYFPQTEIFDHDEHTVRLEGAKSFCTNGGFADSYVVSAHSVKPKSDSSIMSMLILDRDTKGMEWGPHWKGFGMRGNASRSLKMNHLLVKRDHFLGAEGDEIWYVFNIVAPYFLAAMTGSYLGIATRAVQEANNYLKNRYYSYSAKSAAEDSIVQYEFAQLWAKVEMLRRFVYWACQEYDFGGKDALHAILSTKAEVGQVATEVVNDAMRFCGGSGYGNTSLIQRLLRDVRACHVMAPTTELLRKWSGRSLLGQPLLIDE